MKDTNRHSNKSHQAKGHSQDALVPNNDPDKTLKHLEELAQSEFLLLGNTERQRTENYWRLGCHLTDIRRQLGLAHGQWIKYLEGTLHIDYQCAKRACRLRKLYEKSDNCKGMSLELALHHKPSPKVKAAKRASVKGGGRRSGGGNSFSPGPEEKPPTDEEKEALKLFLEACGTVEGARFVLETAVANA